MGPLRPPDMRRVVVVLPSAFTLGNLFFGFWAIVSAYNGNFRWAGWFVVFAGVLDMLDGRVARRTRTTTRFGEELDSLIDVISFGMAPALIMFFLEFSTAGRFAWILCFIYVVAVAVRLARYNVVSAGKPSSWFTGMPSPAAGMTLAAYYPFSQTPWYQASLAYLDLQHQGLVVLILLLGVLMVSTVPYPKMPGFGVRSARQAAGTLLVLAMVGALLWRPDAVLFPLGLAYMAFGLVRATILGLVERREAPDAGGPGAPEVTPLHRERRDRRQEPSE